MEVLNGKVTLSLVRRRATYYIQVIGGPAYLAGWRKGRHLNEQGNVDLAGFCVFIGLLPTSTSYFYFLLLYSLFFIPYSSSLDFGRAMFRRNEYLEKTGIVPAEPGRGQKRDLTRSSGDEQHITFKSRDLNEQQ